jgi:serine/threonine protein kinase
MVNRTIKNFEIKELIATGGMAAIYRAVQVSLDRIVAVKILHGHLAQDRDFITRFEREAKAAANLKHDNIVDIIEFGKSDDLYFIAMEYVEGKSLKDLIAAVEFLPHEIALTIAAEILLGLGHAHQKGVVHRDIKPANILIGTDGGPKIADFGLAQAQDLTSVTVTGSIVGTPAYMSPEQAGGKKIDGRSDIFSLGVVLYEMITGDKPFRGQNYSSIIHEILTVEAARPVEANPLVPREISALIERMIVKDPAGRYQTAREVSDDIAAFFRKAKIEPSRAKVRDFMAAPENYVKELNRSRKEKHLERGLQFMDLGPEKADQAIVEFEKAVQIDPQDRQAEKHLADLKARKARAAPRPVPVKAETRATAARTKRAAIPAGLAVAAAVIAAVLIGFFIFRPKPGGPPARSGFLRVSSSPGGAAVYLDTLDLSRTTPFESESLAPGPHTVELRLAGYQVWRQTLEIKGGDTVSFDPTLVPQAEPAAFSRLAIRSTPAAAAVFLDGIRTGRTTPCAFESVAAGTHSVRVVKNGYESMESSVLLKASEVRDMSFTLKPVAQTPAAGPSYLKVTVMPWAKIYIDDRYIETTPIARSLTVTPGEHRVRLENPDFKVWDQKKTFVSGQTVVLDVRLAAKDGQLKLTVKPWADVYIDGRFHETTPLAGPITLAAGKHVLKLINPTFKTHEETIEIPPGDVLKKHVELAGK